MTAPRERDLNATQQHAAKVAGFLYLFTMATSVLAFYTRSVVIVQQDAAQTAANILASERLFRVGIVADVITFAGVVALLFPYLGVMAGLSYMLPMGAYEIGLGLWLLMKPLERSRHELVS